MTRIRLAGLLAIAFSALAVAADLLLQFTTDRTHLFDVDAIALNVPVWRLYAGHYLGVGSVVLCGVGVWQVSTGLAGSPRLAQTFLVTGLLSYAWGGAFHSTFLFRALVDHALTGGAAAPNLPVLRGDFQNGALGLVAAAALMLVVASVCFSWPVARGRTAFPRWAAAFAPVVVYAALTAGALLPWPGGLVLAPASFNLTSLVFVTLSTVLLWRRP